MPSVIILERAPVFAAIGRSWRLTRGRFWSTLGILVIISVSFSVVSQIISIPLSLIAGFVPAIIAPTGETDNGAFVGMIVVQIVGQFGILLIQCIALVVQSTSAVLVYVDARMRVEALDQDLQTYVEARDAGTSDLDDPYRIGVGRVAVRPAPLPVGAPGYDAQPGSGTPGAHTGYGLPPARGGQPVDAVPGPRTADGAPASPAPQAGGDRAAAEGEAATDRATPRPSGSPTAPPPGAAPAPTTWAAPGSNGDA
ncbi:hypothetical protein QE392_003230 [Microbacterium proteolyticum]|uniref:glycerophosphoryl diester phosphodiesterase membrane domain-containing protein n=1 Tax=Microbacterium proteolyticum TaxID=1572644 RepID=UPI0027835553|nr:glycerophosphoryl diester phosphodiesterase membrane domain-containing protein [Microbacterium proteolyticum]MDQ1171426.1 hypothetical protein [Microbacterium proteolyticum]